MASPCWAMAVRAFTSTPTTSSWVARTRARATSSRAMVVTASPWSVDTPISTTATASTATPGWALTWTTTASPSTTPTTAMVAPTTATTSRSSPRWSRVAAARASTARSTGTPVAPRSTSSFSPTTWSMHQAMARARPTWASCRSPPMRAATPASRWTSPASAWGSGSRRSPTSRPLTPVLPSSRWRCKPWPPPMVRVASSSGTTTTSSTSTTPTGSVAAPALAARRSTA